MSIDPNDLKSDVLRRADADEALTEHAKLVVLAVFEGEAELTDVLSDAPTPKALVDELTTPATTPEVPVGAYLTSITVQGFRGIGAKVTVPLQPGPGLVVVAGRNGSGKSTLAEGLELALTGINSRWHGKGAVWSSAWRNLHAGAPAQIRIGLAEEGSGVSGVTTLGVDWPDGDVPVGDMNRWVQRAGSRQEEPDVLGWAAALEMYRPMLSYDELGGILEGARSEFYDQLYKLLGLDALHTATVRLDARVKALKEPAAAARAARAALRPRLDGLDDDRAVEAAKLLAKTKPDLAQARSLITRTAAATAPAAWRQAAALSTPDLDEVAGACAELREAAARESDATRTTDALAVDRLQLLETGFEFHAKHGAQPCPVCLQGTLDDDWAVRAREALTRERDAAQALRVARSASYRARQALQQLVDGIAAPPPEDAGLASVAAARIAYQALSSSPDEHVARADHVEAALPELAAAYAALGAEAAGLLSARDDAWAPLAVEVAGWVEKAELAAQTAPTLKVASEALVWLQDNTDRLRNERIRPLADDAKRIWAALRQESNVDLAGISLTGKKTTRQVVLKAGVDGSDTEALGVMSQGELQALALAIFIPRATSDASPFRFVVLDDPIQAMDPAKIEGFLDVLIELAEQRQVVVFTHDDRLPAAIRRATAPARLVELVRSAKSVVSVEESSNPAQRALADAAAIAREEGVPDEVKRHAIPRLCRDALERTAWDVYLSRMLSDGRSRAEAEEAWDGKRVRARLTLALGGGDTALDAWVGNWSARKFALAVANKGAHGGFDDFIGAVRATRTAVDDLVKTVR